MWTFLGGNFIETGVVQSTQLTNKEGHKLAGLLIKLSPFRQTIIFAFGQEPYLRRDVSVDVKTVDSEEDVQKLQELQDLIIQQSERWDSNNCMLVDFDPPLHIPPEEDQILLNKYQMPQPSTFKPSRSVIEPMLTKVRHTVYRKIFLC